jgi:hypothetical protein
MIILAGTFVIDIVLTLYTVCEISGSHGSEYEV